MWKTEQRTLHDLYISRTLQACQRNQKVAKYILQLERWDPLLKMCKTKQLYYYNEKLTNKKYEEVKKTPKQKFLTKNKGMRKVH